MLFFFIPILIIFISSFFLIKKKTKDVPIKLKPNFNVKVEGLELELINLINEHRVELGLSNLKLEENLIDLSIEHSNYMFKNNKASHDNIMVRRNLLLNNGFLNYGEITAYGYTKSTSLFNAYLNSPKHREIIEAPKFNCLGVSNKLTKYNKIYNTVIFSKF